MPPIIDVVMPCYRETTEAVQSTLAACAAQTLRPRAIYVVDDGSPEPIVLPAELPANVAVRLIRQKNKGVAAARNTGACQSDADYLLIVDCEMLPLPTWTETVMAQMEAQPQIGVTCGRVVPRVSRLLLTAWRMRFLEDAYEHDLRTREITHATGHTLMVRRKAFQEVGGYDERYHQCYDDTDLCYRMRDKGYTILFNAEIFTETLQIDTLELLARKNIRNNGWCLNPDLKDDGFVKPLVPRAAIKSQTRSLINHVGRNLGRLRLQFLPIDFLVYATSLWLIWKASKRYKQEASLQGEIHVVS